MNVAVNPAVQNYVAGLDVGAHTPVGANGETLTAQGDRTLNLAIHD